MSSSLQRVYACPRQMRPAALRRLHESLPKTLQEVLTHALRKTGLSDPSAWDGLFIAEAATRRPDRLEGVAWVQPVAGNTAVLWAPPGDNATVEGLLQAAAQFVDERNKPLTQIAVGPGDGYSPTLLKRRGFPKLCDLIYMFADVQKRKRSRATRRVDEPACGASAQPLDVEFIARGGQDDERLGRLLEQTYRNTLDCPMLDRVRSMADVLEGYRAQGRYSPDDWYIVCEGGRDVGALIMAEHPEFANWELVYMGVIPEVRGRGIGELIVNFALDVAGARGGERLVLAVDQANSPARKAYEQCGLQPWDRRIVYARLHRAS